MSGAPGRRVLARVALPALVGLGALVALAAPRGVAAQACCAGSGATMPARVQMHERALVGVQARAGGAYASAGAGGAWRRTPRGVVSVDLDLAVFVAGRLDRAQAGLTVPLHLGYRAVAPAREWGSGAGDVVLSGRYDFVYAGQRAYVPGLAATLGLTLPSGRPPEAARQPLGSDASGFGATQLAAGVAVEQSIDAVYLSLAASVAGAAPRRVGAVDERLGVAVSGLAAAGYALDHHSAVALTLAYARRADATLNGAVAAGSGHGAATVGVTAATALAHAWRLQLGLQADLPALARNQPLAASGAFSVLRAW